MFPTCSKSDFAGRNALSAADLTISHPGPALPPAQFWNCIPSGGRSSTLNRPGAVRKAPSPTRRAEGIALIATFEWYVPRALGEETTSPRTSRVRGGRAIRCGLVLLLSSSLLLAACGSDAPRQDANEEEGEFEVAVAEAKFPPRQRLAQTVDLELTIENVGPEAVPNLVITLWTGDEKSDAPFNIRTEQRGLADPNRPVWILEHEFPKCVVPSGQSQQGCETGFGEGSKEPNLNDTPTAGAETATPNTFSFGPLAEDEELTAVWRVTPVRGGTYTVHYEVSAGLDGKAKAVTQNGSPVEGEFVADISTKPPRTRVNDAGDVVAE